MILESKQRNGAEKQKGLTEMKKKRCLKEEID